MCMIMRIITSLKYVMRNVYDHAYHASLKYVMRNVYDHAYHYKP